MMTKGGKFDEKSNSKHISIVLRKFSRRNFLDYFSMNYNNESESFLNEDEALNILD